MASIMSNDLSVTYHEENRINQNSNIKKILSKIIEANYDSIEEFEKIKANVLFKEKYTDIIDFVSDKTTLEDAGYEETTIDEYHLENFNGAVTMDPEGSEGIEEFDKTINFKKSKTLNFEVYEGSVKAIIKAERVVDFLIEIKDSEILDFGLKNKTVYMLVLKENNLFLIKTSLSKEFFELETAIELAEIPSFYKIKMNYDETKKENYKLFKNKNDIFIKEGIHINRIQLLKKYFFEQNGKFYFNIIPTINLNGEAIKKIKIKHLYMYEYLNIFGLNNIEDAGIQINSFNLDYFKDLFKFKFDNTLNGGLNFFDAPKDVPLYNFQKPLEKDYKINLKHRAIDVYGNFNYNYEKGNYIISIEIGETANNEEVSIKAHLLKGNNGNVENLKTIECKTIGRFFYFCNLKFFLKRYTYAKRIFQFPINVSDDYSFKLEEVEKEFSNETKYGIKDREYKALNNSMALKEEKLKISMEDKNLIIRNVHRNGKKIFGGTNFKEVFPMLEENKPTEIWKDIPKKTFLDFKDLKSFKSEDIENLLNEDKKIIIKI